MQRSVFERKVLSLMAIKNSVIRMRQTYWFVAVAGLLDSRYNSVTVIPGTRLSELKSFPAQGLRSGRGGGNAQTPDILALP